MSPGYSGTPLAKKLGIKEGFAVAAVNAAANYEELLSPLPAGIQITCFGIDTIAAPTTPSSKCLGHPSSGRRGAWDIIHFFTNSRDELGRGLAKYMKLIKQDGTIWVSWYKKAARLPTEITEDVIRDVCLPLGLVDVKVCAVDEKWSGLKLVIRRENRV
jgi:hypothetical protein